MAYEWSQIYPSPTPVSLNAIFFPERSGWRGVFDYYNNFFWIFTCGEVLTAGINTALAFKLVLITRPEELTFATNGDFDKTAKRCPVDVTTKIKLEI